AGGLCARPERARRGPVGDRPGGGRLPVHLPNGRQVDVIPEALDGRRIAITGGTGFLGTALIERLLRSVPGCELVLLVRPGKRSSVAQRARREVFRNEAFERLSRERGTAAFDELVDRRVTVIAGDVGTDGLGLDDDGRAA